MRSGRVKGQAVDATTAEFVTLAGGTAVDAGVEPVVRDARIAPAKVGPAETISESSRARDASGSARDEVYGRLHTELQRPARAMVRRAFGGKFSDAEIEDIYANAWVGTLRALRDRPPLSEGELRKYILTAVANHASKELRRRGRKPTAPLDSAPEVADHQAPPEERVVIREQSQLTREILATLPERRRAVLVFRYGWGLKPEEVCGLIKGLSHRAYRKEITRGVSEVVEKLRLVETGRWCADREPLIKALVAGTAGDDERRQAERHLAHCRACAEFAGHLDREVHGIGIAIALSGSGLVPVAQVSLADRLSSAVDRVWEAAKAALDRSEQAIGQLWASGGGGASGAAGVGTGAKLGLVSGAPKIAALCLGTGAAATACVAAGVVSGAQLPAGEQRVQVERPTEARASSSDVRPPDTLPSQVDAESTPSSADEPEPAPAPQPEPAPAPPPAPESLPPPVEPPPAVTEFEPVPPPAPSASGGGAGPASGAEGAQEFGP